MPPLILGVLIKVWEWRVPIVAALALGGAYFKGHSDCAEKFKDAADAVEQEWKAKVAEADKKAFKDGVIAAAKELKNAEIANDIKDSAAKEPGASDDCLSADTVERLRSLQ